MVSFERIGAAGDEEFASMAVIYGSIGATSVRLVPGTYAIEVQLMRQGTLYIPAERRCAQAIAGICMKHIDMPEINLGPTFPLGGSFLNNNTRYAMITPSMVDGNTSLVLYAIAIDLPGVQPEERRKAEDLGQMGMIEDYSAKYRLSIEPETQ